MITFMNVIGKVFFCLFVFWLALNIIAGYHTENALKMNEGSITQDGECYSPTIEEENFLPKECKP